MKSSCLGLSISISLCQTTLYKYFLKTVFDMEVKKLSPALLVVNMQRPFLQVVSDAATVLQNLVRNGTGAILSETFFYSLLSSAEHLHCRTFIKLVKHYG